MRRSIVLPLAIAVVVLVAIGGVLIKRKHDADSSFRAVLAVQQLPPCGIAALVPTYTDDRKPSAITDETALYAGLKGLDERSWAGKAGTVMIISDGGTGPVKTATFTAEDGQQLELKSYRDIPLADYFC